LAAVPALLRRLAARLSDAELAGVDSAPRMLAEARKRLNGVRLEQAAAERLPFADGSFDLVVGAMRRTPRGAAALLMHAGSVT
jgi:ubiquinone/menaquinone biosynthesis C-methylase UbiE